MTRLSREGEVNALANFLSAYVDDVSVNSRDSLGFPPLHAAITSDQILVVQYIMRLKRADKNIRDLDGNTPLIAAVKCGAVRIVAYLVQCEKTDVNAQNKFGWTALHMASHLDKSWQDPIVRALALGRGFRMDLKDWEGRLAFEDGDEMLQLFVEKRRERRKKKKKQ
jgi:hypothetical protein